MYPREENENETQVFGTYIAHDQVRGHETGSGRSVGEEYPRKKKRNQPKVVHVSMSAASHTTPLKYIKMVSEVRRVQAGHLGEP